MKITEKNKKKTTIENITPNCCEDVRHRHPIQLSRRESLDNESIFAGCWNFEGSMRNWRNEMDHQMCSFLVGMKEFECAKTKANACDSVPEQCRGERTAHSRAHLELVARET